MAGVSRHEQMAGRTSTRTSLAEDTAAQPLGAFPPRVRRRGFLPVQLFQQSMEAQIGRAEAIVARAYPAATAEYARIGQFAFPDSD